MSSTENTILHSARDEFVKNGFAATRMQDIADKAGINKALLHYYFRSKDLLYERIVAEVLNTIVPKLQLHLENDKDFWGKTEGIVDGYLDLLLEHPYIPNFMMFELTTQQERFVGQLQSHREIVPLLSGYLESYSLEVKEERAHDFPPMQILLNVMSMCIFPFIIRPAFSAVFDISSDHFKMMIDERRQVVKDFIRNALIK